MNTNHHFILMKSLTSRVVVYLNVYLLLPLHLNLTWFRQEHVLPHLIAFTYQYLT